MAQQKLNLSQSQSLVMTPQLQQAIKLLQYNNMELAEFLELELEKNPLLEKGGTETPTDNPDLTHDRGQMDESDSYAALESTAEGGALDTEAGDYYSGDQSVTDWGARAHNNDFSDMPDLDQTLTREKTLREHLSDQMILDIEDPRDRLIASHIIDELDAAGYLNTPLSEIAKPLGCSEEKVEEILLRVQQFDPAGIAARNLRECLALQLKDLNRFDPAMDILLENLEMLAARKVDQLCKLCHVSSMDLADMIAEIKALNPKPGEGFEHEEAETLIPDVLVRLKPDGDWAVELNAHTLPKVLLNNTYYKTVTSKPVAKEEKKFIHECFQSANWLIRALDQRAQTILKVSVAIVQKQDGFMRYGIEYLKPLTLKDIAEEIEMHESTVSRVTTNKYMATPRGVFELKYFFTSAIASAHAGGVAHSAEFVRHKIKSLIDEEGAKPLSDDKLVDLLKDEGITIARRTVAKYREQLGIGSSADRRRQKAG